MSELLWQEVRRFGIPYRVLREGFREGLLQAMKPAISVHIGFGVYKA